ncbi:reverse transcriptase zinc-binding domain-containing protein, partial [Tanacetum coccineum]
MRQFLWCHGSSTKGKSTLAWETVCLPKREGGLGIRRLNCFNSALMSSHIWKLLTLKESLWVKWVHEYKIKDRNFWDIPLRGNMSWGWRKILSLRPSIRKFIRSKLGNGMNTSLWFDTWSVLEPIASFVSPRDIARAGLSLRSNVMDIIQQGTWVWPRDLLIKHPVLSNYNLPIIDDAVDSLEWYDRNGNAKKFSVSQVWDDIRCRDNHVEWYSMVWFSASSQHNVLDSHALLVSLPERLKADNTNAYSGTTQEGGQSETMMIVVVCRGLILDGMFDPLFDIYQNVESSKELWDSLEAKYIVEDVSSKTFLVNFRRWQKKMHFLLSSMSVVYVLTTSIPEDGENATMEQLRKRAKLGHVHYKRMQDMSKDGLILDFDMDTEKWNKKYFATFIDDASWFCYVYLLHTKDEALNKFKVFKTEVELQQGSLVKRFKIDRGAVVRLPDPKLKTLGERGIECIFVVYAEHSKAFRFYVIEPNDSVSFNSIIQSGVLSLMRIDVFDLNTLEVVAEALHSASHSLLADALHSASLH